MFPTTTTTLLERCRRERERTKRLHAELRGVFAKSLVTLWHSRRLLGADAAPNSEGAERAERAKRSRETVIRSRQGVRSATVVPVSGSSNPARTG